jgi:hypothetical protein
VPDHWLYHQINSIDFRSKRTLPATGSNGLGPVLQLGPVLEEMVSLQSRDKGLIRVPFDGPPMRITPFVTDIVRVWVSSIDSWKVG